MNTPGWNFSLEARGIFVVSRNIIDVTEKLSEPTTVVRGIEDGEHILVSIWNSDQCFTLVLASNCVVTGSG
jgi:hypothetical protein